MAVSEQLEQAGIRVGDPMGFTNSEVAPDGIAETEEVQLVDGITGGGFFGSVIILPDSVIKTTTPDAFHELLRSINWPVPFPSRATQVAAELDYLAGRILHIATPILTDNTVMTPESLGYTRLGSPLGYAQHIERMHGRGPTFIDDGSENRRVRQARQTIWEASAALGAEHTAQVHPDNPFGKPNIWLSDTGQAIWLDYLPAFRHTGRVWPFFRFPFHDQVRQAFASDGPTYNRLHTDTLRRTLAAQGDRFPKEAARELGTLLTLYDERWQQYEAWMDRDPRGLFIEDALTRGLISNAYADRLRKSLASYRLFRTTDTVRLGLHAFLEAAKASPLRIFWDREFQRKAVKFGLNPAYRRQRVLERTSLWGVKQAYEHGLVTEEEFRQALSYVPEHELHLYVGLQTWYLLNSRLIDVITVPLAAAALASPHPVEAATAVSAFNIFAPGIVRSLSTTLAGRLTGTELRHAAAVSLLPFIGSYTAIPDQLRSVYGEKAADLEHYTLRALVAAVSRIRPWGGWDSDLEEKIWNMFHRQTQTHAEHAGSTD